MLFLELLKNRFHVFAGAKSVDSKVGASAVKIAVFEVADLDGIAQAAARFDGKI